MSRSRLDKKTTATADLGASLGFAFRQALMQVEGMLPAQVAAVDRGSGRCSVKPMIMAGTAEGQKVARPVVANVPIVCLGAGGIYATYPVKVGDLGFLFASDRDTSLFYQAEGKEDWPNTERLHSFSDGGFLPLRLFDFSIAGGVEADGFCLQTESGETFITIREGEVQIQAQTVKIIGNIEATKGNMTSTGKITTVGDITSGGKSLQTHTHSGVETGGGSTGAPN